MTGGVYRLEDKPKTKCRKWLLRIDAGSRNGERIRKTKTFKGCERDAKKALKAWMDAVDENQSLINHRAITFDFVVEEFLQWKCLAKNMTQSGIETNRCSLKQAQMHLGKQKIEEIEELDVLLMLKALRNGKSPSGKRLSETTLNKLVILMKQVFKYAMRKGYVQKNCMEYIDTPSPDTKKKSALSKNEIFDLLGKLPPTDAHHVAIALMLLAGLRRAEACKVEWRDVNLQKKMLFVRGTKTSASMATIPICDALCAYLLQWQMVQGEFEKVCAEKGCEAGLTPNAINLWWKRNRHATGYEVTLHAFRHSYITALAKSGVHPSVMARLARHSDCRITLDIYTHVNMDECESGVEMLDEFLRIGQ